ncbi:MAG: Na/Pi cotransporter family protein [Chloroflexota bacterium]|nr:Na/Pi cotransporter family protein [Chloroflexota bacterium]
MNETLEWGAIIIGLFGGLAIFLFGMELMTRALKGVAGNSMKDLLGKWTTNKFKGAGAGALVTAIIQSSSVTTVTVVGFVSAGLMTLQQAMGVIMGANIGTTITAHLVAFDVVLLALLLAVIGFALMAFVKRGKVKEIGGAFMGLALLFIGMELMGVAMEPLAEYEPFVAAMGELDRLLPALIFGAIFTALVQSSSATIGVVIAMAGQGLISLETGIAIVLGANIGTSVTAILGSLGQSRTAQQAAAFHTIFNTVGALIWLPFVDFLANLCVQIAPEDLGRQIAWATTIFNVGNTAIFIWFTTPLEKLVRRILPDRPEEEIVVAQPKYLDDGLLNTPALALDRVRMEVGRLGEYTVQMVQQAAPIVGRGSEEELTELAAMDDNVDVLHSAIITYLQQLAHEPVPDPALNQQGSDYLAAANSLESIADMVGTNLVAVGSDRLTGDVHVSDDTAERLGELWKRVSNGIADSVDSVVENEPARAQAVFAAYAEIKRLAEDAETQVALRLTADEPNRVATYRVESDIIQYLKRMYFGSMRIAKLALDTDDWRELIIASEGAEMRSAIG